MKAINMFNIDTGEIRPAAPNVGHLAHWFKIWWGWQPQYDINNQYIGYKDNCGNFRDMR